jgi:hypothetical protein
MGKKKSNNHLDELLQNGEVIITGETHEQVMEEAAAIIEETEGNAFVSIAAKKDDGTHYAKVKTKPKKEE